MAQAQECLAALLAADVDAQPVSLCGAEVLQLKRLARMVDAATAPRLARFEANDGHEAECASTTAAWLGRELNLDPGEARREVAAARALRDLPATAAALAAGEIGAGHVAVFTRAVARVGVDVVAEAEPVLLTLAVAAPPAELKAAVDRLAAAVEADEDREAAALRRHEGRHLHVTPGFGGGYDVSGSLDEAGGAVLVAYLQAAGGKHPLPDGTPDPRTRGQRWADALVEGATVLLDAPDVPTVGKLRAAVTLVTDLDTLRAELPSWAPSHPLVTVHRRGFGPAALDRLVCCADITPAVVDGLGVPLALGRTTRLATGEQMRALWLRDGGCVMPGCPNRRVQAHHIVPWYQGGTTDLAGMALVCDREHTLLHEHRWTLEPDPGRPGLLRWRPPDRARPPIPACHAIDRDLGHTTPLW